MNIGTINAKSANWEFANSRLTKLIQSFLGAAFDYVWIDGTEHSNDIFVILAFDDELSQLWTRSRDLLQINLL